MSPSTSAPAEVSMWLKLQLAITISLAVIRGAFSSTNAGRSWKRAAHISTLRAVLKLLSGLDPRIAQKVVGGSTGDTYRSWATAKRLPITSDDIEEGAYLHWIGEKQLNSKVLLYFHGGGFAFPATADCLNAVLAWKEDADDNVGGLGVAFLEYSLTPGAPFPTQLRQATAALTYLLSRGVSPSSIVLGGDSAGGNLILQLMSHILHPLPDLPSPPQLSAPLAGIILVSPWTSFNDRHRSFKTNAYEDVLPPDTYMYFAGIACVGVTEEMRGHLEPTTVPSEWWMNFSNVTSRVLITVGEKECLFDQVADLAQSLESHTQVEKVVQINGVHEDFIFAFGAGSEEGRAGDDYKAIVAFLTSVLG